MTPYQYVTNNPIMFTDPTGMKQDGDYYSRSGEHLGSDGKKDKKVYAADSVTKNKDGIVTSAENAQDLGINSDQFLFAAQTLYAESSSKTTNLEVAGIYSVMENRAEEYGTDVMSQMSPNYPKGVYGSRAEDRKRYSEKGPQADSKRLAVRSGLILGLTSDKDYSNGAFFWDGTDFKSGGGHKQRYVPGYSFTNGAHDIYGLGNNSKPGSTKYGKWNYKYESTGAIGKTTFSRLTNAWRDAQYAGKRMAKPLGD